MTKLELTPFEKDQLIEGLQKSFPQYKIQTGWGGLQVRTSGFTVTGNVKVDAKPEKGIIRTSTNLDMVIIYLLFIWPLAVYILIKSKKQKAMEAEVAEGIKKMFQE
jgi:hypothetical protein